MGDIIPCYNSPRISLFASKFATALAKTVYHACISSIHEFARVPK